VRILLTGGSGFIGTHILSILEDHQVLLLGREEAGLQCSNVNYHKCDLSNTKTWENQIRDFCPNAGIHLAWGGLPDYSFPRCLENFNFSINLINVLASAGCKTIFSTGTCWEYGDILGQVGETDIPGSMSLFPSFKTGLRLIAQSIAGEVKANLIWGRVFFVYGPGQRETSLIPTCYRAIKNGIVPQIKNFGAVNDFIHVSDVASAIKALVENPEASGVFNIGSGSPVKVSQVCEYVAQKLDAEFLIPNSKEQVEPSGLWADISLIKEKTGWEPKFSLQEGIERTIDEWDKTDDYS
jgi:nucleoside-diphosphate-sugar epimerase